MPRRTLGGHAPAAPAAGPEPTARLGDLLVDEGLVTASQVAEAVRIQKTLDSYAPLGHILIKQGLITRERHRHSSRLGTLLVKNGDLTLEQLEVALQLHIRFFPLDAIPLDVTLRPLLNERFALEHRVLPVARVGQTLVVAMDDPTQNVVVDELRRSTNCTIEVITSTTAGISRALTRLYHEDIRPRLDGESVDIIPDAAGAGWDRATRAGDDADTIVRKLLRLAVDRRVSDIHLETVEQRLQVRFRIDGMLQHFNLAGLADDLDQQRAEVFSRLKILSGLDIAERRRPQDGGFRARIESEAAWCPWTSVCPSFPGTTTRAASSQDLGVDTNVCTTSLIGVLAQRLVREICWNCKQEYTPPESLLYEVFGLPPGA